MTQLTELVNRHAGIRLECNHCEERHVRSFYRCSVCSYKRKILFRVCSRCRRAHESLHMIEELC
jgi:lipopolysaccharide biosynthesis regulator YciM